MKHSTEFSNSRHSRNTGNHLYQAQPVTLFFSSPFFLGVGGGGGRIVCVCVCVFVCVFFFSFFLHILYANCINRTVLYMCI